MLRFAVAFLVIAAIAGVFGFGIFTDYQWLGAKIVFFIFLALALATWLGGTFRMWSDKTLPAAANSRRERR